MRRFVPWSARSPPTTSTTPRPLSENAAPGRAAFSFPMSTTSMSTHQITLLGLPVQLDRAGDRRNPCHDNRALICDGVAPHAYGLRCATCQRYRGWLGKPEADFLAEAIAR